MTDTVDSSGYRLEVENFGPIAKGSVDFRPLTVLIGPSNTGKSYLAILTYALHRCFGGQVKITSELLKTRRFIRRFRTPTNRREIHNLLTKADAKKKEHLESWIVGALSTIKPRQTPGTAALGRKALGSPPAEIERLISSFLTKNIESFDDDVNDNICQCFAIDAFNKLARHSGSKRKPTKMKLSMLSEDNSPYLEYDLVSDGKVSIKGNVVDKKLFSHRVSSSGESQEMKKFMKRSTYYEDPDEMHDIHRMDFINTFVKVAGSRLLNPLRRNAFYLPAGRTGIMHSHHAIVRAVFHRAASVALDSSIDVPQLPFIVADFLDQLFQITTDGRVEDVSLFDSPDDNLNKFFNHSAERIENDIIRGKISTRLSAVKYPIISYNPENWDDDLPLMRTSAMVSELTPVILYLRYLVNRDDILIIEEPESHLHPAMQTAFARELARIVRDGVRVIITTHSPFLLETFANLVHFSKLPKDKKTSMSDVYLDPEQFGAWLFVPSKDSKGSVVKEIFADSPDDLTSDYDEVSNILYNEWAHTEDEIHKGKG